MKINVIIIDKKGKDSLYSGLIEHYKKISKPFAKVEVIEVYDKEITKAHDISPEAAQKSYTKALEKYISDGGKSKMYWIRETKEIKVNEKRGLAWENGIWNGYDPEKGDDSIVNGNYSAMWIKESGIWKIKSQLFVTLGEK